MAFKVVFLFAVSLFVVFAYPQDAVDAPSPAAEEPIIAPAIDAKKEGNACEVDGKPGKCMDFESCPKNPDGIKRLPNDACDSFLDVCCFSVDDTVPAVPGEAPIDVPAGAPDAEAPAEAAA